MQQQNTETEYEIFTISSKTRPESEALNFIFSKQDENEIYYFLLALNKIGNLTCPTIRRVSDVIEFLSGDKYELKPVDIGTTEFGLFTKYVSYIKRMYNNPITDIPEVSYTEPLNKKDEKLLELSK